MSANLDRLRAAYKAWNDSKGGSIPTWTALIDDNFVMESVAPENPTLIVERRLSGAAVFADAFESMIKAWEMQFYRVDTLIEDGDKIAMFGECEYKFKANRQTVRTPIANLWEFKDGKAIKLIEIFDSAKAMQAALAPAA